MPPLVSVLVAAFNAEQTLADAMGSVYDQSCSDWEMVVVDDGSTDATLEVARSASGERSNVFVLSQRNAGTGAARNLAASHAHGTWMLPLDADDLLEPHALARQLEFISEHDGADFYSMGYARLLPGGRLVASTDLRVAEAHEVGLVEALMNEAPRMIGTIFVRSSRFEELGGYRTVYAEDLDLLVRGMTAGARWIHNPAVLHQYRETPTSKSRDRTSQVGGEVELYRWFLDNLSLPADARTVCEVKVGTLSRALALDEFRSALESGDWRESRRRFADASPYLRTRTHWRLLSPLIYAWPSLARAILRMMDRMNGQATNGDD